MNGFFDTLLTGILRSGAASRFGPLDQNYIRNVLLATNGLPAVFDTIPVQVPASNQVPGYRPFTSRTAITRLLEGLGSNTNPYPFTLLEGPANGVKGRLAANNNPRDLDKIKRSLDETQNHGNDTEFSGIWSHVAAASTSHPVTVATFANMKPYCSRIEYLNTRTTHCKIHALVPPIAQSWRNWNCIIIKPMRPAPT